MEEGQSANNLWVKEIGLDAPKGFKVSNNPITYKGNLQLEFTKGYSLPTIHKQSLWDNAYYKSHVHPNREVIDNITSEDIERWNSEENLEYKGSIDFKNIKNLPKTIQEHGILNVYTKDKVDSLLHKHPNKDLLDSITPEMLSGNIVTTHTSNSTIHITADERTNWNLAYTNNHTHGNKSVIDQLLQGDVNVLRKLSLDAQGNVKVDATLWATGGISALGLGEGEEPGTGGASYDRLDDWITYDAEKAGWVLSAKLGKDLLDKNNALSTELSDKYNELRDKDTELATDLENKYNELKGKDGDKYYEVAVNMPSKDWEIYHNLNKYPSVTVINNDNQIVIGDVQYIDENNLIVSFSAEFTGKVICN